MQTVTAGHLDSNGGIRGHSAGLIFPYRIMIQGKLDNLTYWVMNPKGRKCARAYTIAGALVFAELIRDGYLQERSFK